MHNIEYDNLNYYLNLFGVRDDKTGEWLDWDKIVEWANKIGVPAVPVLLETVFKNKDDLKASK